MSASTRVSISLPENGVPTKTVFKDIVSKFLTQEWPYFDPESLVMTYDVSHSDINCTLERLNPLDGGRSLEPLKVFIKIHKLPEGDISTYRDLRPTKNVEAQLCYELGRAGYGPQMLGFFQTQDGTMGRIDEFIDSHTLEPEDVERSDIRADIARGHAVLHAMDKPWLSKKPVVLYYDAVINGLNGYCRMQRLKDLAQQGGVDIDALVDYDFASKVSRVVDRLESTGGKKGWCIHDVQYMNVLVKNKPQPGESKVTLIDFELVFQNYRAFDIGGHFMQKMFKWTNTRNKLANCRPYSEDEMRHFCEEYARKWNQLTGDSDTGEQVFAESELGYLLALTFDIHNMLLFMDEDANTDPLDALGLNKLFEEFVRQYGKLGFES